MSIRIKEKLALGSKLQIQGAETLTSTTLGNNVIASSLTSVGTLTSGTWQASTIAGKYGGTGVDNDGKTITLGGNLTTLGSGNTTFNITATTLVTLPTSGTIAADTNTLTFTNKTISLANNTLLGTVAQFNSAVSDGDFATLVGTETFTNKTISLANNTLLGTVAEFNSALSDGNFATVASNETLTNKTISLANNSLTGTVAEFNSAVSDGDFATVAGNETLTNKTISLANNSLTGTLAQFNTALSDGSFATLAGTETLTNKTVNLTNNTLSGTLAQFNTALSDQDFATLAGTETLTNKTVNLANNSLSGTLAQFNTALSDGSFASLAGTETFTNKTISLANNSLTGTLAQFNTALSDGSFASLAGNETLTNKTISLANNSLTGTVAEFNSSLISANFVTSDATTNHTQLLGNLLVPATFTIDPAAHGDNTGTVVIAGNLQVDGITTTINSTTLVVDDVNVTLASGSVNAAASNGAGITVDLGSDGTAAILYDATNDDWKFNKSLQIVKTENPELKLVDSTGSSGSVRYNHESETIAYQTWTITSEEYPPGYGFYVDTLNFLNNPEPNFFAYKTLMNNPNINYLYIKGVNKSLLITSSQASTLTGGGNITITENETTYIITSGGASPSAYANYNFTPDGSSYTETSFLHPTEVQIISNVLVLESDKENISSYSEIQFKVDGDKKVSIDSSGNLNAYNNLSVAGSTTINGDVIVNSDQITISSGSTGQNTTPYLILNSLAAGTSFPVTQPQPAGGVKWTHNGSELASVELSTGFLNNLEINSSAEINMSANTNITGSLNYTEDIFNQPSADDVTIEDYQQSTWVTNGIHYVGVSLNKTGNTSSSIHISVLLKDSYNYSTQYGTTDDDGHYLFINGTKINISQSELSTLGASSVINVPWGNGLAKVEVGDSLDTLGLFASYSAYTWGMTGWNTNNSTYNSATRANIFPIKVTFSNNITEFGYDKSASTTLPVVNFTVGNNQALQLTGSSAKMNGSLTLGGSLTATDITATNINANGSITGVSSLTGLTSLSVAGPVSLGGYRGNNNINISTSEYPNTNVLSSTDVGGINFSYNGTTYGRLYFSPDDTLHVNDFSTFNVNANTNVTGNLEVSNKITANSLQSYFVQEYVDIISVSTIAVNADVSTNGTVIYMTVNMAGNTTVNVRGDASTTFDSLVAVNDTVTVVFMFTNGATAYINNIFQIDQVAQTVKWNGGAAPAAGTPNAIDVYSYTIIKTAANTYTVLGSFSSFA